MTQAECQMARRDFLAASVAGLTALSCVAARAESARKPNVIVIYTDDQGSCDLPCYGATDLVMPNVESLAARGIRFTQFYAPAPVCSPSRAGLLTGRYPISAGVPGNVSSIRGDAGMPAAQVTMAEMFRASGYATAHIGKWHLGFTPETMPNAQGFDHSFGHMGGCIDNYSHFMYWSGPNHHDLYRNGQEVHEAGRYFPDLMVDEARGFIDAHRESPFFMYFALNVPHYPYQGDAKWLKHYQDAGVPYPRDLYAAFLSSMDERIGRLLEHLKTQGLQNDTIVVYQSDHGYSTEERAHFGGGFAGQYRGSKFSMFEGGIRIPAIISWPGHIAEGQARDQIGHGCDWMPTLAKLCDIPLVEAEIDGRSLTEVIDSATAASPHNVLHWQTGIGEKSPWAVRQGDWKLLGHPSDPRPGAEPIADSLFLVNLRDDLGESTNVSEQFPEKRDALLELHRLWISTAAK